MGGRGRREENGNGGGEWREREREWNGGEWRMESIVGTEGKGLVAREEGE